MTEQKKTICVIGLGYIGLPTSVMFAGYGHRVHGVDVNEEVVHNLNGKRLMIEEPGLQERLDEAVDSGNFKASVIPVEADVFIIAVPSPITENKQADISYVKKATEAILPYVKKGDLIILESTVPPKTVDHVIIPVLEQSGLSIGEDLLISHSPERVIPGRLFSELVSNDRIVGGINKRSSEETKQIYETFVKGTIHITDATTAEMVKVIENTYRDVNIAYANELARMSEVIGVNAWEAIELANHHPRVNIHTPGPGVGGHCIAVDPWFLVDLVPEEAHLIHRSRMTNDAMPAFTAKKIKAILESQEIAEPSIAVFGLSFKGNIDDTRESPSFQVIEHLDVLGYDLTVYDPHVKENRVSNQTQSLTEAVKGKDLIVILTDHQAFKDLSPEELSPLMRRANVLDAKNVIAQKRWKENGFHTWLLGDGKHSNERAAESVTGRGSGE